MRILRFHLLVLAALATAASAQEKPASPVALSPDGLVADLYKAHEKKSPFFQTESRPLVDRYFTKQLADLIWKDVTVSQANNEIGAIDPDPLYDSNDPEPTNLVVHPAKISKGKAEVAVSFMNLGKKIEIEFSLIPVGGAWKIADIRYSKTRTLLGNLKAAYGK